ESPRGGVQKRADDPPNLTILPIVTGATMDKYDFIRRVREERAYGRMLAAEIARARPDMFITCTTPNDVLDVLRAKLPASLRGGGWLQDIYSMGIKSVLNRKLPLSGSLIGRIYRAKEKRFARRADHIVSITPD